MGWIGRLLKGSEASHARNEAEAARERVEREAHTFERWAAALGGADATTKAVALEHLRAAAAGAEKDDLPGWLAAREQCELARQAYCKARAALARAHPRGAALLLLQEAGEAAAEIRDPEDRSARCAELGVFQAHSGDVEGARRTLDATSEPADRASIERAVVLFRARTGAIDPARLARELAAADVHEWNETLLVIAEERIRRGDASAAQPLIESIEDPDLEAQAQRLLVQTEARLGRWDEARKIAGAIEHPHWSAAASSDLALARAMRGDIEGARKIAEGIQNDEWRATAQGGIAGALARAGNEAAAAELAEGIQDPFLRDDARIWIAEALAERGNLDGAIATIAQMGDRATQASQLVTLAESARAAGKPGPARELVERAIEAAGTQRSPAWLAQFVVDARVRLGEFEAAEAAVHAIGEERGRAELLANLAFHVARRAPGGLQDLEELLHRHPGAEQRLAILQHGARGLLSLVDEEKAATSAPR